MISIELLPLQQFSSLWRLSWFLMNVASYSRCVVVVRNQASVNKINNVANIILLFHNLAPKDAMPVNYFIQYAGLILETIHIKPD